MAITHARVYQAKEAMPPEYRAFLTKLLVEHAEMLTSPSYLGFLKEEMERAARLAPTEDDRVTVAWYVREEVMHGLTFFKLMADLDPALVTRDLPQKHYAFHLPMDTWADVGYFHFLIDLAGAFQAEEWVDCSYAPLARIAPQLIRDEHGHSAMGEGFLRRLVETEGGRRAVEALLPKWYPAGLDMFGRSSSRRQHEYIACGLKRRTNEDLRRAYKAYVDAKVSGFGVALPDATAGRRYL